MKFSKLLIMFILFTNLFVMTGCEKDEPAYNFNYNRKEILDDVSYPNCKIMIISDLHFYDKSLGIGGKAFDEYLMDDRKLLIESEEMLQAAIKKIINEKPEILLVPGDLTKDGEKVGHKLVAKYLKQVKDSGISVFVVPGNHDIENPHAVSYSGTDVIRVETVTENEFRDIYNQLGYSEALYQDEHSLSYIVEPVSGLWLFCMDSTITETNYQDNYPMTEGEFKQETVAWMEKMLAKANGEGKAILIMHHHAIVPHWEGQEKLHDQYIVEGYKSLQKLYTHYNAKFVFTGHYHSQDIAKAPSIKKEKGFLYDIETGSLVTYPCPIRIVEFKNDKLISYSYYIKSIPSIPEGFETYAAQYVYDGVVSQAKDVIEDLPVKPEASDYLADKIGKAYQVHYKGDEKKSTKDVDKFKKRNLGFFGRLVAVNQAYVLKGLWKDTEGSDNSIIIDIFTGEWE